MWLSYSGVGYDINSFGRNYQAACSTVPHLTGMKRITANIDIQSSRSPAAGIMAEEWVHGMPARDIPLSRKTAVELESTGCQGRESMEKNVPEQITREDLLSAIAALDRHESHSFGRSTHYDLLEGGRRYPPKAVVGLAARRTLGRPLRPDEFEGGEETWAFVCCESEGSPLSQNQRYKAQVGFPARHLLRSGSRTQSQPNTSMGDRAGSLVAVPPGLGGPRTTALI